MPGKTTIGRKVAAISMRGNFDRVADIGGIAWFKCKAHPQLGLMSRKQARRHYMLNG